MTDVVSDISEWYRTDEQDDLEEVGMERARLLVEDKGTPPTFEDIRQGRMRFDAMMIERGRVEVEPGVWMTARQAKKHQDRLAFHESQKAKGEFPEAWAL